MPSSSRSPNRREQILHAALQLFGTQGYEETSLQDIIDKAGVSKGGFYHHFRSKADLVEHMAESVMEMALATVEEVVDRPDLTAIEKLNEHTRLVNSRKTESPTEIMVILFELYGERKNLLLEDRLFSLGHARLEPLLHKIIEQGVREKVFHVTYPQETAELYVNLFLLNQRQTAEAFTAMLKHGDPAPLAALKRRYAFFQDLVEHTLGLEAGSLVLEQVAADTLDNLWLQFFGPRRPGEE